MDLSFPPTFSVNSGIPLNSYLDSPFKLRLPGIDRLCELILAKGRGCCVYKKDLQRAYRQFPIDPKDYYLLGFTFDNHIYFDTRCPFGLRTSTMICQRTTKAVKERFIVKELQSLLGKLSSVTACGHASRIFLSRLLNALRSFRSNAKSQLVTLEMRHDLAWW